MIHDYTRKRGIVHSEILLPPNAPPDFQDRGTLWNSVEQIEKACNSQLARELEVALPIELSREEQVRIVRAYCSSQFVSRGMCADFNIHDTGSGNPHAHILLTMRPMDERGKWLPKSKKEYVLDESGERIRESPIQTWPRSLTTRCIRCCSPAGANGKACANSPTGPGFTASSPASA